MLCKLMAKKKKKKKLKNKLARVTWSRDHDRSLQRGFGSDSPRVFSLHSSVIGFAILLAPGRAEVVVSAVYRRVAEVF